MTVQRQARPHEKDTFLQWLADYMSEHPDFIAHYSQGRVEVRERNPFEDTEVLYTLKVERGE